MSKFSNRTDVYVYDNRKITELDLKDLRDRAAQNN